jgi:DNA-binding NtrC family response regulator
MDKLVTIVDTDRKQCSELCFQLEERQFHGAPIHSLPELKRHLQSSNCKTVIIDIDTVSIDNYSIKDLTTKNPEVCFFCLSKDHFHPELKDVIGRHIYACISKPVDLEELFFWLEAVHHNHDGFDSKSPA